MLRFLLTQTTDNLHNERLAARLRLWESLDALQKDDVARGDADAHLPSRREDAAGLALDVLVESMAVVIGELEVGTEILLHAGEVSRAAGKNRLDSSLILVVGGLSHRAAGLRSILLARHLVRWMTGSLERGRILLDSLSFNF